MRDHNSRLEPEMSRELWASGEESYSQVGEKGIRNKEVSLELSTRTGGEKEPGKNKAWEGT